MMNSKSRNKIIILLSAVTFLIAVCMYLPMFRSTFIWDDIQLITHPLKIGNNPYAFLFESGFYYRPIVSLSMAVDFSFWHLNPMGYHLTNILLHAINSMLVFLIGIYLLGNKNFMPDIGDSETKEIPRSVILPFISAILFALHPIHTESVAWISGRTDILATLFFLLAFLSFLVYEREGKAPGLFLTCLFFLFSMFGKENAASFIFVIFVYGMISNMPRKNIMLSIAALSLVIIAYFLFRQGTIFKMMLTPPGSKDAFFSSGASSRNFLPILSSAVGYYFEKLVLPFNLNLLPQIPERPLYLLISLLPLVFGGILYFAGYRLEFFFIAWVILTLSPSLFIIFSQIASPIGERYLYLPSVGYSFLLGLVLTKITPRNILFALASVIVFIYAFASFERLKAWKDEESLWADTAAKSPTSAIAHANYGAVLLDKNKTSQAKDELLLALRQKQLSPGTTSIILDLLGTAEASDDNFGAAEIFFKGALKADSRNAVTYNNLGMLYLKMSSSFSDNDKNEALNKAIRNLKEALNISPGFIQPKFNLGLCYLRKKDYDKAKFYFISVIESDPRSNLAFQAMRQLQTIKSIRLETPKKDI